MHIAFVLNRHHGKQSIIKSYKLKRCSNKERDECEYNGTSYYEIYYLHFKCNGILCFLRRYVILIL